MASSSALAESEPPPAKSGPVASVSRAWRPGSTLRHEPGGKVVFDLRRPGTPPATMEEMSARSDRELVEAAREGDSEAFGVLVRRHQRRIYRLAAHLLGNAAEAEDVAQDTFVRAYGALARFDGRSEPFTWIYRIAVNLSLNVLRSRKTRRGGIPADDPRIGGLLVDQRPGHSDPARHTADRELALALCSGIDELSDTLRTTLILVSIDGLSHTEAAGVLGCPEGTVAWRVHEARRKLNAHLAAQGHEPVSSKGRS